MKNMKKYLRLIITFALGITITLNVVACRTNNTNNRNIPIDWDIDYHQLYVVGDSLSDNGALVGAGSQILKLLGQNNGLTLASPFYQNRSFSNGPVAAEVLANKLNLTLEPAWDFDFNNHNMQQIGTNYAFAGATTLDLDSPQGTLLLNHFTINKQVDALLKQHKMQDDDLTIFEIGSNDLISQILETSIEYQEQVIEKIISKQKEALEKLLVNGSKHILVMNSPDLSKTPSYLNEEDVYQLSAAYSQAWSVMISNLQAKYPYYLKVFDLYHQFYQLLSNFENQGIDISQEAVTWKFDINVVITQGTINPQWNAAHNETMINKYFFFDSLHPTAKVHQAVGELFYKIIKNNNIWWY